MWHYFWMGAFLWHSLFYAAFSSNTKETFSFKVEMSSSGFPTHAYAFRGLIFKKKEKIAWVDYHLLYQDHAKECGYDALITFLQAFSDAQVQKKIDDIMAEDRKTSKSTLTSILKERKLHEVSLLQKRQLLMRFLLNQFQQVHKEINSIAVEIPHGYTKEEIFYKQAGFEFIKTFERKKEYPSNISGDKDCWEIDLFKKDLRK